jgi:mannose-6-phosphate isomerase
VKTTPRRVDKPWGYELIWAETGAYVGKILHVRAGEALSLQKHLIKDETLHLLSGEVVLLAGRGPDCLERVLIGVGESVRIHPGIVHRIEAVRDSDLLEASTPHLDDVVRLQDRYGRAPGRSSP